MLKKSFLCLFLIAIFCNFGFISSSSYTDSLAASKRGAIFAVLTSLPCLGMDSTSLPEKIGIPVVACIMGGLGGFVGESLNQQFTYHIWGKLNLILKKPNFGILNTIATQVLNDYNARKNAYNLYSPECARTFGQGFGMATGLAICLLCYTKTGIFERN